MAGRRHGGTALTFNPPHDGTLAQQIRRPFTWEPLLIRTGRHHSMAAAPPPRASITHDGGAPSSDDAHHHAASHCYPVLLPPVSAPARCPYFLCFPLAPTPTRRTR